MTNELTVEVMDEPTLLLAARRATVPFAELPAFYDAAYGAVAHALGARGLGPAGPAYGWYASMPSDVVDVAAGFAVEGVEPGALGDGVEVFEVAGGPCAVATYVGPYDGLGEAWGRLEAWRSERDQAVRGDFWEVYVTEPSPDGDPAANVTRLVLPLA
ncbi:effector-binding domain-containing protein [Sediminihabitans luteus]|uniref:Effector-binding domain-containing protein n=1 Tax=Sediminihabitans luteus TaxID=1138585 RepID=A0A2M9D169_9CELL|nr:GyrI-like domain-containing protein [Sediminihabitans luteus]PJJ77951.1 effector-binding domain-containing protein [Sediminihabitans luteus]GII99691.1 transcriptional regulator [Sediminihabitans luteus]